MYGKINKARAHRALFPVEKSIIQWLFELQGWKEAKKL